MSVFAPTVVLAMALVALPAFIRLPLDRLNIAAWAGSVSSLTISPTTVAFPSSSPNSVVSVSTTIVAWSINLAAFLTSNWTLAVSAVQPVCTNAPLSSIVVTCTAVGDIGIALGVVHSCSPAVTLSTTPQIIATGQDALLVVGGVRGATVQYTFSDLWKYTASTNPCNITFTYTLNSM